MWDCCQTRVNSTDFIFRSTRGSPDADQHAPIYIMASNNYNVSLQAKIILTVFYIHTPATLLNLLLQCHYVAP